jgi:hypothetical protein
MYLVSSKHFKRLTASKKPPSKIKRKLPQSDFDKWIAMSGKLREEDVIRKAQLKDIAKFMRQVLPEPPVERLERITPAVKRRESLSTAAAEIAPKKPKFKIDDDVEDEVSDFGELASPYLKPYLHNARFLDKQYGIRREDDGRLMIGDSVLTVDDTSDISINGRHFKGTRGLWELLTRKNVTRGVVTADDLKRYKTILQLTNAHLQGFEPGGNVQTSRGPKFREVISKLFPQTRRPRGVELSLSRQWERY